MNLLRMAAAGLCGVKGAHCRNPLKRNMLRNLQMRIRVKGFKFASGWWRNICDVEKSRATNLLLPLYGEINSPRRVIKPRLILPELPSAPDLPARDKIGRRTILRKQNRFEFQAGRSRQRRFAVCAISNSCLRQISFPELRH